MADSQTPNLNLVKPEVGSSTDTWGGKTNGNWNIIDAAIQANIDAIAGQIAGGAAAAEVTVAAAATTDVFNAASENVLITGATTITSFGNGVGTQNKKRIVRFAALGAVIKNNAVIQTITAADIVVEIGDIAVLETDATSPIPIVRMTDYVRATGEPLKFADRGKFLTLPEIIYTSDIVLTVAEAGKALIANRTTAITFTLPTLATAGTIPYIVKNINTGVLTIDPAGTELIEGAATMPVEQGCTLLMWPGTGGWRAFIVHAKATVAEFRAGVADRWVDPATIQAAMQWVTLVYAATMNVDHQLGSYRKITLTAAGALAAPTNPIVNFPLDFWIIQGGSGNNALTWDAAYDFGDYGTPVISLGSGQADRISFLCLSASPVKYAFAGIRRRVD